MLSTSLLELLLLNPIVFSLSLVSRNLLISLISSVTSLLFSNVLFNLHELVFFAVFSPLQLISSIIALLSEKMLDMISIFLNLLRHDLWSKMQSLLENDLCALEKKAYSSFILMESPEDINQVHLV